MVLSIRRMGMGGIPPDAEVFVDGKLNHMPSWEIPVQSTVAVLAGVFVSLRLYSRISLKRRIAVDDIFIVGGLIFAIARAVVACLSSQEGWAFREGPRETYQIQFYTHYFERRLFYALGAWFIRMSVLTYYLRLFPSTLRNLRLGSWALLGLSTAQCLQLSITLAAVCNDILDLYHSNIRGYNNPRCSYAYWFTYSGAIGDAVIDAAIYIMPIPYVWGLRQIKMEQRIGLVVVFGLGLIACVFALLQIPFIISNYRTRDGEQWFGSQVSLFIAIELALGLITAALPDIRGLIARSFPNHVHAFKHTNDSSSQSSRQQQCSFRRPVAKRPAHQNPVSTGLAPDLLGPPLTIGAKRKVRKPDWLRSTLASSLMDTMRSRGSISPVSQAGRSREDVPESEAECSGAVGDTSKTYPDLEKGCIADDILEIESRTIPG